MTPAGALMNSGAMKVVIMEALPTVGANLLLLWLYPFHLPSCPPGFQQKTDLCQTQSHGRLNPRDPPPIQSIVLSAVPGFPQSPSSSTTTGGAAEKEEEEGLFVSVSSEVLLSTWIGALLAALLLGVLGALLAAVGCTSWRPGLHCIVVLQHL